MAKQRGYECDLVLPQDDSLSCPICFLPFRDPHLVSCCGAKYCESCIAAGKPCPLCKQEFNSMLDRALQRKVLDLDVRCLRKNDGCEWEGKLRNMSDHEKDECQWGLVECRYKCGEHIVRHQLTKHEQNICKQRPIDIKMETLINAMEERHKRETTVAKEEFERILREERESHKRETEQKEKMHAAEVRQMKQMIAKTNVEMNQLRKSIEKLDNSPKVEMQQLRKTVEKKGKSNALEIEQLRAVVNRKEKSCANEVGQMKQLMERKIDEQNKNFQVKVDQLQESLCVHLLLPPCEFIMTDYLKHKSEKDQWYSSPFYTRPGGYKMCIRVDANGEGVAAGTHVSVYVYLMKGEYDDGLPWPFSANIMLQIVNQSGDQYHHNRDIPFYGDAAADVSKRVTSGERSGAGGLGFCEFMPHNAVESTSSNKQYIKSNCLKLRLSKIVMI